MGGRGKEGERAATRGGGSGPRSRRGCRTPVGGAGGARRDSRQPAAGPSEGRSGRNCKRRGPTPSDGTSRRGRGGSSTYWRLKSRRGARLGVPPARCSAVVGGAPPSQARRGNSSSGMHGRSLSRPRRLRRAAGRAPCAEARKEWRRARFSRRGPAKEPRGTTEVGWKAQSRRAKLLAPSRWESSKSGLLTASRQKSGSEISCSGQGFLRRTDGNLNLGISCS